MSQLDYCRMEKHDGFDALSQGCLIDVEYILGIRSGPKESEVVTVRDILGEALAP